MREPWLSVVGVGEDGLDGLGFGVVSVRDFPPRELAAFEREIEFEERVWEEI